MIRGWLLVLCALLTVWEPVNLGLLASSLLPSLVDHPSELALLALRIGATALGVAAGIALWTLRPDAVRLAKVALCVSALTTSVILLTPYFPSNRLPGTTGPRLAVSMAYYAGWYAYLVKSRRVRQTYGI